MGRIYHSASSDALGQRCNRAWFYRYVAGIVEPRVSWSSIAHYIAAPSGKTWHDPADASLSVPSRARSTALGTEMHKRHEQRYLGARVDWSDLPGQIALSGLHFLPDPARSRVKVEAPIGDAAIVGPRDAHAPPVGFRVAGVLWAGYRDLVAHAPEEHARLGIGESAWALYDYKSTADIARYALTRDKLVDDFAANLYALATCTELDLAWLPARWVYFETKRARRAAPVDAVLTRGRAFELVAAGSERARALDAITTESDATPNTDACDDYGGCPYHHSAGGPCNARRSFGASLVQLRAKKEKSNMPLPAGITQLKSAAPNGTATAPAFAPPPAAGAGPGFAPQFAPPPIAEAPAEQAAPPPPPEPAKKRQTRAAPAPAPVAAAPADVYDLDVQRTFGPLKLVGDARDVITAAKLLRGV